MVGLEYWPVVATGVVILIAIAASNRALGGRIDVLGERVAEVRERLARIEGLLEGVWLRPPQSDDKGRGGAD